MANQLKTTGTGKARQAKTKGIFLGMPFVHIKNQTFCYLINGSTIASTCALVNGSSNDSEASAAAIVMPPNVPVIVTGPCATTSSPLYIGWMAAAPGAKSIPDWLSVTQGCSTCPLGIAAPSTRRIWRICAA